MLAGKSLLKFNWLKLQQPTAEDIYLDFEREVFLHVLDDQDEKRQLDGESLLRISRTRDVCHAAEINNITRMSLTLRQTNKKGKPGQKHTMFLTDVITGILYFHAGIGFVRR